MPYGTSYKDGLVIVEAAGVAVVGGTGVAFDFGCGNCEHFVVVRRIFLFALDLKDIRSRVVQNIVGHNSGVAALYNANLPIFACT